MENPHEVIILGFTAVSSHYIDVINDVEVPYGALTWRRANQEIPDEMRRVFSLPVRDALEGNTEALSEAIMDFNHHAMITRSEATAAAEKLQRSIRTAVPSGDGWGYVHSKKHAVLVKENERRIADSSTGKLSSWERELLGS